MKMRLPVLIIALTVLCVFAGIAAADEEYSASGTIKAFSGSSITFVVDGESYVLNITDDTEVLGDIMVNAEAYVTWVGSTALFIDVAEMLEEQEKE